MVNSNSRDPIIIEFAGVSGSGKSSLVSALEEKMKEEGLANEISWEYIVNSTRFKRFFKKLGTFLATFAASPGKSVLIIGECLRSHRYHPAAYRDIINIFYLIYRYRLAGKAETKSVWIFDQGLVQACWSLLTFGKDSSRILDLVLDDVQYVVVVTAEPDIARKRLRNRTYKGSRPQKKKFSSHYVGKGEESMDRIIQQLSIKLPDEKYISIENNGYLDQASDRIYNWVRLIIDDPAQPSS